LSVSAGSRTKFSNLRIWPSHSGTSPAADGRESNLQPDDHKSDALNITPLSQLLEQKKVKGLDIYIPPLTGKPWPAAVYKLKCRTDRQWH